KAITPAEVIARSCGGPAEVAPAPAGATEPAATPVRSDGGLALLLIACLAFVLAEASGFRNTPGGPRGGAVLCTMCLTCFTFFEGQRIGDRRAGILSALFLLGMWRYLVGMAHPDAALFGIFVNGSLITYLEAEEGRGRLKRLAIPFAALSAY